MTHVDDQVRRLAAAAQYPPDRGFHVIAAAPGMVALRMVLDGHADVVISPTAIDLPGVQIAEQAPPLVPRPRPAPGPRQVVAAAVGVRPVPQVTAGNAPRRPVPGGAAGGAART